MNTKIIGNQQTNIISFVKNYIFRCKKIGVDVANSSICYFINSANSPGAATLRNKFKGNKYFLKYLKVIFLNIFAISQLSNYYILKKEKNKKFKKLIISNSVRENFKKNGSYFDSYFQLNSRETKDCLWFLNCVDNFVPDKFDDNLIIFTKKNKLLNINLIFFFKRLFKCLYQSKFSFKKVFNEFSFLSEFSNIITHKVLLEIKNGNFEKIINSYEAQPFQNNIFDKVKKINKKIKTIGFYHTTLHPMPTGLIYRSGSPDLLLISGNEQKKYLVKNLNWPNNKIKIIPSFRYKKNNMLNMSGFIFLPYDFFSSNKIIYQFKNYLKSKKNYSINFLKIRNHPHRSNSKKHLALIKKLEKVLVEYKNKFSKKIQRKNSVFIGSTSSIILALELKVDVVHICEDPVFDSYSQRLWKGLKINHINDNMFEYRLKKRGSFIKFSDKNYSIKQNFI